jgi:hypothetical protein
MASKEPPVVHWLSPWVACSPDASPALQAELAREAGSGHPLAGASVVAIGRRVDTDDVLFWLPEGPALLAEVHLTWTGHRERMTNWPWTELFESVEDWTTQRMLPDHHTPKADRP